MNKKSDFEIKKERMLKKFKNINVADMKIEDVEMFMDKNLKSINRSAFYQSVKVLNDILKEYGNSIVINSADYVEKLVVVEDERYYTKHEIIDVCNTFLNPIDKFIVYALFNGIMGKGYADLTELKVSDVADDYSFIMVNDEKFECDDYMKEILKATIKSDMYFKNILGSDDMKSTDYYFFNESSPYIIKVKPTKGNANGMLPMSYSAIQRRLTRLQDLYEDECGEHIYLNGKSLGKSGIMYDMFLQSVQGKEWTIEEVQRFLDEKGAIYNKNEVHRSFYYRYYGDGFVK